MHSKSIPRLWAHRMGKISGHVTVTLHIAYSSSIGCDSMQSTPLDIKYKNHEPKCYLSVTIHLLRERGILETK